jgi:hypothetical protein
MNLNNLFSIDVTTELMRQIKNPNSQRGLCPEAMKCNFINTQINEGELLPLTQYTSKICHDVYGACPRYQKLNSPKQN